MGSGNDEEAVTVDTRGLIAKVLSRYSGKWYLMASMFLCLLDGDSNTACLQDGPTRDDPKRRGRFRYAGDYQVRDVALYHRAHP